MKAGLYDVLRGRFKDGASLASVPESQRLLHSVMSNLTRLFNTRQGTLPHLPGYGLPDPSAVYMNEPFAVDGLRQAVKEVVQKYEPRLRKVYVEQQATEAQNMRVSFIISAELEGGQRVRFRTTFAADDLVQVSRWTRRE